MPVKRIGQPRVIGVDTGATAMVKWVLSKIKMDEAKSEQARVRPSLVTMFEDEEADSEGHRYLTLPEPIEGFTHIQYQRRVATVPNQDVILERLEKYGLLEQCTTTVRVPDEEEIMKAVYSGLLPEEELADMYSHKESFAMVVKRG